MVDLGKYGAEVLSAYGITILLIAGVIWASVARSRKMRRALEAEEERARRG